MKTNRYIQQICLAALALIALSCSQEEGVEKKNPEYNPSGVYSFVASAGHGEVTGDATDTRATMGPGSASWTKGDKVRLSITNKGTTDLVSMFNAIPLEAMSAAEHTTFFAELVQTQYTSLTNPSGRHFDYYSFFPDTINGWVRSSFPSTLQFTMPNAYTIAPNTFVPALYAPMVAVVKDKAPEIFLPKEDADLGTQIGGLHFDYKHILSYAAIEMDVRLLPGAHVTSITMTVGGGTNINGTMTYTPSNGNYTLSGGSNSFTVTISGGLSAGTGDVVYIPMPVKDLSGQTLTFSFTTNSSNYSYHNVTTSACGINFERGKIHRIRVAPAAEYKAETNFTVTKSGYYYIEAWGGDGGSGETNRTGGVSQKISGLYQLTEGQSINLYVGSAGTSTNATGGGTPPAGGTNGSSYGNGGAGGNGGGERPGGKGGGGGAGTFVFLNGTSLSSNLLLVSGGGGGGGGSAHSNTAHAGGTGGNGGAITSSDIVSSNGVNGNKESHSRSGSGGQGNGTGGSGKNGNGDAGSTTNGDGGKGANGVNGFQVIAYYAGGGAGGGGGGGWLRGGGGGGDSSLGGNAGAGGGGAGGASYLNQEKTVSKPGLTLPTNTRPSANGHVVITFFRE